MTNAIVHLKLSNYTEWRPVFNQLSAARKEVGSLGGTMYRSTDTPNEVTIVMGWKDLASAHDFCDMPDWKELIKSHSISGMPEVFYSDVTETLPA